MRNLPDVFREFDRPFASLWREFERPWWSQRSAMRPLDDPFADFLGRSADFDRLQTMVPSCDVKEKSDHYVLSFDMPGLEKDNIEVELRGNQLIVSGERKQEKEEGEGKNRLTERSYSRFERIMTLPSDVKGEGIEAQYQNGVLSLALPKSAESKTQKIKIGEAKTGLLGKMLGRDKSTIDVKKSDSVATH